MVPCLCLPLSGQQTEASLTRAHQRIKELEVGLAVFGGIVGGGVWCVGVEEVGVVHICA